MARALENLGHEVRRIQESNLDWSTIPQQSQGSDVLLWTRTAGFDPGDRQEQGRILKGLDIPTVGFHLDKWWQLRRETTEHGPRAPDPSPFFWLDYLFTADGGNDENWKSIGANHYWSPPAILSNETALGNYREDLASDLAFVGSMRRYGHPEWGPYRYSLFKFLTRTYGNRFRLWEGGMRGRDLADLYASVKVLVGDSCLAGGATRYWSDRVPETLGRGGFLFHPEVEGLDRYHPDLATYPLGDFDYLRRWIDYYLEHEDSRVGLARQYREHVIANHTYEHRLERVLSIALG